MNIGILGLGIIGSAWARNLEADGLLGGAWNRTPRPSAPRRCASPADVAATCDILIIVVADPPAVRSVIHAMPLDGRHLVIQSSTIDPASSREFCARVRAADARYVEAPFTGSKPAAEQRKTVFYLGGHAADLAAAEPALARLSEIRRMIGAPEQAAAFKLAQNLLVANYAEALCESLQYTRRAGIPDEVYFDTLRQTMAWNGFAALKEQKFRNRDFSTQFSVKHMLKDMKLALGERRDLMPLTQSLAQCLQSAADRGWAEDDLISLIRGLEP
jgi:3-hydroxyisobutyrate dehydrogenase-like beta-hydroxyacid dehydrogenase